MHEFCSIFQSTWAKLKETELYARRPLLGKSFSQTSKYGKRISERWNEFLQFSKDKSLQNMNETVVDL